MAFDMTQYEGAGHDTLTDSGSMPLLTILQDMSPEVKKMKDEYIEGAQPGDILFKSLGELVNQPASVVFISKTDLYTEWKPRNSGGGLVAFHPPSIVGHPSYRKGANPEKPYLETLGENELKYTNYWLVLIEHNNEVHRALLAMSGSQLAVSRKLQGDIRKLKLPSGAPAPLFAYKWDLSTQFIESDKGDYHNWVIKNPVALDPEADEATLQLAAGTYDEQRTLLPTATEAPALPDGEAIDAEEAF